LQRTIKYKQVAAAFDEQQSRFQSLLLQDQKKAFFDYTFEESKYTAMIQDLSYRQGMKDMLNILISLVKN